MKTFHVSSKAARGWALAVLLSGGLAQAADYPGRITLDKKSRTVGLGVSSVPLIKRAVGPGHATTSRILLDRFKTRTTGISTAGAATSALENGKLFVRGTGWYLEVEADGTAVRYRNDTARENTALRPVAVANRIPNTELETLGRQFVQAELQGFIPLAANEQLVPLRTEYQVDGDSDEATGAVSEALVLNTVVFGRSVGGVVLVGAGSKVAIHFGNDRLPVGFDFDWPVYASAGKTAAVLPLSTILGRGETLMPTPRTGKSVLKRFECGMFDGGVRRRNSGATIQPACFAQRIHTRVAKAAANALDPTEGLITSATAYAIPAGSVVEPDIRWPEAMILCTGAAGCGKAPSTSGEAPTGP